MSYGGGGGGAGKIATDSDVALNNPSDGQVLAYSASLSKWQNQSGLSSANLKAVCVYSGSAYPSRPSGFGSVEWIGPVDPGSAAQDNDTWVDTA